MDDSKNSTLSTSHDYLLVPEQSGKDLKHRIRIFRQWMQHTGRKWYNPDFITYRDYLLNDYMGPSGKLLSPRSVRAHLSTVRAHYQSILRDNRTRDRLYTMTPEDAAPSDKKAYVDEIIKRIENAIDPENSAVKVINRQDTPDADHLRLTIAQADRLIAAPGTDTLMGLRDTALIALLLSTGIREAELCALDVPDLRQQLGGTTALHVRRGKGAKERLIPYGNLIHVLDFVDNWMTNAGIDRGPVFRGFYKGGKSIRDTRLNVRSVNKILNRYPVYIDGHTKIVRPHDLRRTYARRLYDAGLDLLAIRDNLGHADTRTTLKYIGAMDVEARQPPAIYNFASPDQIDDV